MAATRMMKIFYLCQAMDVMAQRVYTNMAAIFDDPAFSAFWHRMAAEEAGHVAFWQSLIPLAEDGMIPEIFDKPAMIIADLEHNFDRARALEATVVPGLTSKQAFTIAFRLEYYLLHPVFEAFFTYARELRPVASAMNEQEGYEDHINSLITALGRFCADVPEMELLGDTLRTLWSENRRLATAINTDNLTGLMNRRGFFNAAQPLMDLARRDDRNIGIILADLDDFKGYNTAHGHEGGDVLLKSIGLALRQVVRSSDLVARFSGEEFIILFYALESGNLDDMARKMRKTISACSHNGAACTASVGAASLLSLGPGGRECCVNLEEVLSQATRNLEEAKRKGKDQAVTS